MLWRLGRERNGGGARSWADDALTSVDETDDGQEDGLPRRGLEHHGLALTFAVQIYVRAVVLLLVLRWVATGRGRGQRSGSDKGKTSPLSGSRSERVTGVRCEHESTHTSGLRSRISTTFPTRYGSCLLSLILS